MSHILAQKLFRKQKYCFQVHDITTNLRAQELTVISKEMTEVQKCPFYQIYLEDRNKVFIVKNWTKQNTLGHHRLQYFISNAEWCIRNFSLAVRTIFRTFKFWLWNQHVMFLVKQLLTAFDANCLYKITNLLQILMLKLPFWFLFNRDSCMESIKRLRTAFCWFKNLFSSRRFSSSFDTSANCFLSCSISF